MRDEPSVRRPSMNPTICELDIVGMSWRALAPNAGPVRHFCPTRSLCEHGKQRCQVMRSYYRVSCKKNCIDSARYAQSPKRYAYKHSSTSLLSRDYTRRPSHDQALPSSTFTHLPSLTASQPSITPSSRQVELLIPHTTPSLSPNTARSSR